MTRKDFAAAVCRAIGWYVIVTAVFQSFQSIPLILGGGMTRAYAFISLPSLAFGIFTVVFSGALGAEMTGEISPAHTRSPQTLDDVKQLARTTLGYLILNYAVTRTAFGLFNSLAMGRFSWVDPGDLISLVVGQIGPVILMAIGATLAFRDGIRARFRAEPPMASAMIED